MKQRLKKIKAFTLIEIIVVVIIVGLLASAALMRYDKTMIQAKERDAINQLKVVHSTNTLYYSRQGHYMPTGTGDLAAINQGMSLNILSNDLQYQYIIIEQDGIPGTTAGDGYWATAVFLDGGGSVIFRIRVDQDPLSTVTGIENPCCDTSGKCSTLPDC